MLVALALLAAGALVVRGAGQVLPEQLAMFPALALVASASRERPCCRVAGLDERLLPATALGAAPVLGLAAWIPLLLVALVAGLPLAAALWTLLAASAVALALAGPPRVPLGREALGVALAGLGTAVLAARWAKPVLESDALFHAGRVRKLVDLHHLSFGGLSAYQDGHVHAGYAFPIVHAAEAGAVELAGVDPSVGFLALVPAFAFLSPPRSTRPVASSAAYPPGSPWSASSSGMRSARRAACSTPASSPAASSFGSSSRSASR